TGSTATAMTIDNAGHVGIGTTNPTATLTVNGGISLPGGSLNAFEIADEPGVACDIRNGDGSFQYFSGLHTAASRSLICPAPGYVLAIGTVELVGDNVLDTALWIGVSSSSSGFLITNR